MNIKKIMMSVALVATIGVGGCGIIPSLYNVPAGHVGVLVERYGTDKGVQQKVLTPGRYWLNWNQDLFLFPTFQQQYCWTKAKDPKCGSLDDESIHFQDRDGTALYADFGISYSIDQEKVAVVFQKWRKGVEEITHTYMRQDVANLINRFSAKHSVIELMGEKKAVLVDEVLMELRKTMEPIGIHVDQLFIMGDIVPPDAVREALNAKIRANQLSAQRENEVAQSIAEAKKKIEEAKGDAESIRVRAESQATANKILSQSITATLVFYKAIDKWNGSLPTYFGGSTGTLMQLPIDTNQSK